jgi:hypothetical protein
MRRLVKLRHVLAAFVALMFALGVAAPASAQYGSTVGNGRVSKGTMRPGECTTFTGDGFAPGSSVVISDNGQDIATVTADDAGNFTYEYCTSVLGVHLLRGTGTDPLGGERIVVATVVVAGRRLAATGSDNTVMLLLSGLGLVVAGSGTVLAGSLRRRRRASAAA